jgi:phosphoglycerate dehydrogenase-like enzyme
MRLLIASPICPRAIESLRQSHSVVCAFNGSASELASVIHDRNVIVFRSGVQIDAPLMSAAPSLRLLIRAGSGLDNLDLEYVNERGLHLERIEAPGAKAVAELSFCLMLSLARQLRIADESLREGRWVKHEIEGHLLHGKTLGIYGCGNIGSRVGRMAAAWGMHVLGCIEKPTESRRISLRRQNIRMVTPQQLLRQSDFVSLHLPLTAKTQNMIDRRAMEAMKDGAILVNLARGGIVDEKALYDLLTAGRLRGAGMDVHSVEGEGSISPLASLENVLLTPHIGAGTVDTQMEIGERVVEIVTEYGDERTDAAPVDKRAAFETV